MIRLARRRRVFDNGLTLLMAPDRSGARFALRAYVEGGLRCEPPAKAGLCSLVGQMLEEGAGRRSGNEITRAVEAVGGTLASDFSGIAMGFCSENWELAVDLCADMLRRPQFPRASLARRKALALGEIRSAADDPRTVALRGFHRIVYGEHPLGRPIQGHEETLRRLRLADLVAFHERWYAPQRIVLAAAGGLVDPERFEARVERRLGRWRKPAESLPGYPQIRFPAAERIAIERQPRAQVNLYLGHLGIRRADGDYYALKVMDHILGTSPGFTDRLSRRLRDELGLAYAVGGTITASAGMEPGALSCYIGTAPGNVQGAVDAIVEELQRIGEQPPESAELELAREYLQGSFACSLEHSAARANYLLQQHRFDLPADYHRRYPAWIAAVGREEVHAAAARHIRPSALQASLVGEITDLRLAAR